MNKKPLCLNFLLQMVCLWGMAEEFSLTILCELQHSFIDQVLNLIFQCPTAISVMPQTIGMISASHIRVVLRRGGVGILRRILQCYQLHLQHVLQYLSRGHVDFGELPFGHVLLTLIALALLLHLCWVRDPYCPHILLKIAFFTILLVVHNTGLLLSIVWSLLSTWRCSPLNITAPEFIFNMFSYEHVTQFPVFQERLIID